MNYLAHLYLAEQSREGLLGSLLGDFVKGRLDDRFPETVRRGTALHRTLEPEDLGGLATFLASDESALMTGQTLVVDAGRIMLG